jgi:hypothetical protein
LTLPIEIIYGALIHLIINSNIKKLAKLQPILTVYPMNASHEVKGAYVHEAVKAIKAIRYL